MAEPSDIVLRDAIPGTHAKPNLRRLVLRRDGDDTIEVVEQMAHHHDPLDREQGVDYYEEIETVAVLRAPDGHRIDIDIDTDD